MNTYFEGLLEDTNAKGIGYKIFLDEFYLGLMEVDFTIAMLEKLLVRVN